MTDMIIPRRWHRVLRAKNAPWFIEKFREMKRHGVTSRRCWRKMKSESSQILVGSYFRTNAVVMMIAMKLSFATTIASAAESFPSLFMEVWGLLDQDPNMVEGAYSDKIDCIYSELDSRLLVSNQEMQEHMLSCLWDSFQLVQHEYVDRILDSVVNIKCF